MLALPWPRTRGLLAASALSIGLSASLVHADTLTVGPDADVYDFASISFAINAAKAGDTILVAPGDYGGFHLQSKPLTILGSGSGQTFLINTFTPLFVESGTLRVSNVNEGRVRIGGFTVQPPYQKEINQINRWVTAEFCEAPIELFDIEVPDPEPVSWSHNFQAPDLDWYPGILAFNTCRQVHLSDVRVTGYAEKIPEFMPPLGLNWTTTEGYAGLSLWDTRAWCSNCWFEGCSSVTCDLDATPIKPILSGAGARLWNSQLISSNSRFQGGIGHAADTELCVDLAGGRGMDLKFGSRVELYGGPQAGVFGGDSNCAEPGGHGIEATGPALVMYDPSAVPTGGLDDQGVQTTPIAEMSKELVQVVPLGVQRPSLVPGASVLQPGTTSQLELTGTPGGVQVVLWQAELGGQLASPLIQGDLFLDPATASMLGVFPLDAAGQATASLQVPAGSEFIGISIAMQTTELIHPLFYPAPPIFLATAP